MKRGGPVTGRGEEVAAGEGREVSKGCDGGAASGSDGCPPVACGEGGAGSGEDETVVTAVGDVRPSSRTRSAARPPPSSPQAPARMRTSAPATVTPTREGIN
nr:hypothetical protein GCM10020093_036760 [Planobispora longispora]